MRYLSPIVALSSLLLFSLYNISAQVVESSYVKQPMEEKRLIIAPVLSIDSLGTSFVNEFPEIPNPRDSLTRLIEEDLQFRMRRLSRFRSLYFSEFNGLPRLSRRTLLSSRGDTIETLLPVDGDAIRMHLRGRNPVEPDFVLFLQIGSVGYDKLPLGMVEGILLTNVTYVFWDNKQGRVAAYDQRSLFIQHNEARLFRKESPFATNSEYVDLVARYILTKTPFAKPDMLYYFGL